MHLADAFAGWRRYATRLIAGYDQQPRLFGLARGGVATLRVFGSAGHSFAACGFETALLLRGASRLLARFLTGNLAGDIEAALLLGLAGGSFFGRLLSSFLACCFETPLVLGRTRGGLSAGLFPHRLAGRFDTALVGGGAGGGFATGFFSRRLAGRLTNGIKAAGLFRIARQRIAFCVITRYGVMAWLAAGLPALRPLASGIVSTGFIAPTFALARIAAFRIAAWTIVTPLAPRPAVAIAPLRLGQEFILELALRTPFIAAFAAILTVRAAFVFDVVSARLAIA
jgi:hypothetical protein